MRILKKACALLCCLAVLMSGFLCVPGKPAAAAAAKNITLRVEGQRSTIYSGSAGFADGESLYNIMKAAFDKSGVSFETKEGPYGHEIISIGGESGTYPVWWHIYQNGKAADVGMDSLIPQNGDEIVVYLGDDSVVLYPTVTVSPQYPVEGEKATVNVSCTYTDYSDYTKPVTKTEAISGATVTFNGVSYTTDKNGNAQIKMPKADSYILRAFKENKDTTHAIVRTGDIAVTVYTADTVPAPTDPGSSGPSAGGSGSSSKNSAVNPAVIEEAINAGARYILKEGVTDWGTAFACSAAGVKVPQSFFENVAEDIEMGGTSQPIHLAGLIIGLKAAGADPRDFNGTDLVAQLYSSDKIGKSGLNGYVYTLLALDCGNYQIPAGAPVSREGLIDSILSYQQSSGAFSLDKTTAPDSDMTAMALTALSPYIKEAKVKGAADAAVDYLSKTQQADGGFLPSYASSEVSESTAQVVIALASCGIDPAGDERFVKNGNSPLSALMAYRNTDGGFSHIKGGGSDLMATGQAVMALEAYRRYISGGRGIYDLTGIKALPVTANNKIDNPRTEDVSAKGAYGAAAASVVFSAALASVFLKKRGTMTR